MKILTWNINGIRASKVPLKELLDSLNCDVICFQETKVTRDQLDEASCIVEGYNAYFSYSKKRSGYSGVATFCRNTSIPTAAEEGLTGLLTLSNASTTIGGYGNMADFTEEELRSLDAEGRAVMTQHNLRSTDGKLLDVVIINVYCPRADRDNQERFNYKLRFYELLQLRAEALVKAGRHVVVVGDMNVSHKTIDHCDPDVERIFKLHPSRKWLDQFLCQDPAAKPATENPVTTSPSKPDQKNKGDAKDTVHQPELRAGQFMDTFRCFHPDRRNAFTCWMTLTNARQTNYGSRIDYIFADEELLRQEFVDCDIMPEVEGSDHCPVKAELTGECEASGTYPALCTKFMPEFSGKQQKLSSFFQKVSPSKKYLTGISSESKDDMGTSKKRGNELDSSYANKNTKKQKRGAGKRQNQGGLLNFFQRKDAMKDTNPIKPTDLKKIAENTTIPKVTHSADKSNNNPVDTRNRLQDKTVIVKEDLLPPPPSSSSQESTSQSSDNSKLGSQEAESENSDKSPPTSQESTTSENSEKSKLSADWKTLFKGLPPPPLCKVHKEPCVLRTVKKAGPNRGKRFYVCAKPEGHKSNPDSRCDHFEWMGKK